MSCCLSDSEAREYIKAERDADILENINIHKEETKKAIERCCKDSLLQDLKDFVEDEWQYKVPSDYNEAKTTLLVKIKKIIQKHESI